MGSVIYRGHEHPCTLCEFDIPHTKPDECRFLPPISGGGTGVTPPVSPPPPPTQPFNTSPSGAAGATAGSLWVESSELHFISSTTTLEYAETGASQGSPPSALVGSMWVESNDVHYIDASGVERIISKTAMTAVPPSALIGSMWLETSAPTPTQRQVQWVGSTLTNRYQWWNGV